MSRAIFEILAAVREQRDEAFDILRDVLTTEDTVTKALGAQNEPEYVGQIRALLDQKVDA